MSVDPNIITGATIALIGTLFGFALCFSYVHVTKWLNHRSSLRQLDLREKTRKDALQAQLHKQAITQQTGAMPQVQPGQVAP